MKFGYARVSTSDQNIDLQIKKLQDAGCDEIFHEKTSGLNDDRKELEALLKKIRKGDLVCVVRLDRLGRRMTSLIKLMQEFRLNGIEFVSLENNIDTTTPMGMLLFNICAAISEMEGELIRECIKVGLDYAHNHGRIGGRPRALTPRKEAFLKALCQSSERKNMSVEEICEAVGISRSHIVLRSFLVDTAILIC